MCNLKTSKGSIGDESESYHMLTWVAVLFKRVMVVVAALWHAATAATGAREAPLTSARRDSASILT